MRVRTTIAGTRRPKWSTAGVNALVAVASLVVFAAEASAFHEQTYGNALFSDGSSYQSGQTYGSVTLKATGVYLSGSPYVVVAGRRYHGPDGQGRIVDIPCYAGRQVLSAPVQPDAYGNVPNTTVDYALSEGQWEFCFYEYWTFNHVTNPVFLEVCGDPYMPMPCTTS